MTKIGLGLAALGRPEYINIRSETSIDKSVPAFEKNTFKVLDLAYNLGIRHFDTAPSYGKGEVFLLHWNQLHQYSDIALSTKWGYTYVADWELGYHGAHEIKEHSLKKLNEQWENSKGLLPALKIYQIHSATLESGVLENQDVLEALMNIKRQTGTKIGISTSGPNQPEIIQKALKVQLNGSDLFDSFQVTYNILDQSCFTILREAKAKQKFIIIKEGLANGRVFKNSDFKHYNPLYLSLEEIALKYKVGIDAIALRFCMDSLGPDIVLSGAANENELRENMKAESFHLATEEIEMLKQNGVDSNAYWEERKNLKWY
jgi:aryl-alcohol dehydrogenase-like predicted oxidoreductase